MKKLLVFASLVWSFASTGQEYINSQTFSSASQGGTQMDFNSSASSPEMLASMSGGFRVNRFVESTGAVSLNYNYPVTTGYTPVASAFNGSNKVIVGYTGTDIYLHYVNNVGGQIYAVSFPRWNSAKPVDIVYNGAGYFYLVCESFMTAHPVTVLIYKIDAATGACITGGRTAGGNNGEYYIPQDIEVKSASEIFITGIFIDVSGTKKYFVAKVVDVPGKVGVNEMEFFNYGNATTVIPSHCYLKINGSNFYFAADATTPTLGATKLVFLHGTYSVAGSPHMSISVTNIYQNFDCNGITSVSYYNGYLAVGFSTYTTATSLGANFLYNVTTYAAQIRNYAVSGNRNLLTVISPVTGRLCSASAKGTTWHNLRTMAYDPTATVACNSAFTYLATGWPTTVALIPNTFFNYGITYTTTPVSSFPNQTPWVRTTLCNALPIAQENDNTPPRMSENTTDGSSLQLFPNPAQEQFTIRLNANTDAATRFEIYNTNGSLVQAGVLSSDNQTISVTDWAPGIYLVRLSNESGIYTQRFIRN
jgi:hypothetical protein